MYGLKRDWLGEKRARNEENQDAEGEHKRKTESDPEIIALNNFTRGRKASGFHSFKKETKA